MIVHILKTIIYAGITIARNLVGYLKVLECVRDLTCVKYIVNTFGAVKFICGVNSICNNTMSYDAVQLAKTRLNEDYLLIGITEDIHSFMVILEHLLPDIFSSLTNVTKIDRINVTKYKARKTDEIEHILFSVLNFEIDLYKYVKQRFYQYKQAILV